MELHDGPSTSSGLGGHTTPAETEGNSGKTEKKATKLPSKLTNRTTKSNVIIEKHPGQPGKAIMSMSTCELKACLRARKLSALGKKSTLRNRLLMTDIPKMNPPKKELTESSNLEPEVNILSLQPDTQELDKRNEHDDTIGKFSNRLRGSDEPLEEYFFSMVRMSELLNLPLEHTCSTIIAGLRNNKCSNSLAGVKFASIRELFDRLKTFEAPSRSNVTGVRKRHRQQNRLNRCFRCNNRHPLYQQCWQFNERY